MINWFPSTISRTLKEAISEYCWGGQSCTLISELYQIYEFNTCVLFWRVWWLNLHKALRTSLQKVSLCIAWHSIFPEILLRKKFDTACVNSSLCTLCTHAILTAWSLWENKPNFNPPWSLINWSVSILIFGVLPYYKKVFFTLLSSWTSCVISWLHSYDTQTMNLPD